MQLHARGQADDELGFADLQEALDVLGKRAERVLVVRDAHAVEQNVCVEVEHFDIQADDVLLGVIAVIGPLVLFAGLHQSNAVIVAQRFAGRMDSLCRFSNRKKFFHFEKSPIDFCVAQRFIIILAQDIAKRNRHCDAV